MLALWLCIVKCLRYLFCYMFKLKICGVAQSLVLNYFALLSLCLMSLLQRCVVRVLCADKPPKGHGSNTSHFCSSLPKRIWQPWTEVLSHCVWVFAVCFPSGGVVCKAFVCFLMFLYACVGCTMVFCLKVNWSACQLSKCNLCFAFWRLFWCSSQVLLCFNVSGWMYMLSFVFPCTLPCPTAFLVLRTCCTS